MPTDATTTRSPASLPLPSQDLIIYPSQHPLATSTTFFKALDKGAVQPPRT